MLCGVLIYLTILRNCISSNGRTIC